MGLRSPYKPHRTKYQTIPALMRGLNLLEDLFDHLISFGHPGVETDPGSATLAGDTASSHPGTLLHINGSWVEKNVTALDTAVTCYHNLDLTIAASGEPNVRWIVFAFQHDGNSANAASVVSCNFEEGDTVAANSIQLRFYAAGARVVDADHPLKVSLFFIPAVRRD